MEFRFLQLLQKEQLYDRKRQRGLILFWKIRSLSFIQNQVKSMEDAL